MHYIDSFDRNQMMITTWDAMVDPESTARLIDSFVDSLNLSEYGVKELSSEGRPPYDPRSLYKLYIYGSDNGIKSSRKLAKSCKVNIEVKWMLGGVEPDFRTISDFRKDNIDSLKKIFREFNKRVSGAVEWGFTSIDGSKFAACNSKNNNFTKNKLDDRIKWLNGHIDEYLRILDDADKEEEGLEDNPENLTKELIEEKLKEARERLAKYEGYQKLMEESGQSQMSLTDADAKLMKSKNGFTVAYNPQTAVDSNTHLIRDFQMTNQVTDHGLLDSTLRGVREESEGIIETVADRGYESKEDMVKCLEEGIIPHVITDDGKDGYEIEIAYQESDVKADSTEPEELRKALHAGVIPDAYKDVISDMEVFEVRRKVRNETEEDEAASIYGTEEEMRARAKEGYFVRDPERNFVYCPGGEMLRQKCIKKNGNIRYANKNACRHCPNRNKCYKGKNEWKEVDFTKDCLEKPCKDWLKAEGKSPEEKKGIKGSYYFEKKKIVRFFLKPNREKTAERMCLSEHPFGTIKRGMGFTYFLLRGMRKVTGEFALMCLGYNIKRAKNLLGYDKMMELMVTGTC